MQVKHFRFDCWLSPFTPLLRWANARYLLRFLADLVNCHVVSAGSLLQLLDNFVDAALEEGVPQVEKASKSTQDFQKREVMNLGPGLLTIKPKSTQMPIYYIFRCGGTGLPTLCSQRCPG